MTKGDIGRVLLLRCDEPVTGAGPTTEQIVATAVCAGVRCVLLDAVRAPYADSDGLRWLLELNDKLEQSDITLRIAAKRGGRIWRNLALLDAGLGMYDSVAAARKNPPRRKVY